MDRWKFFEITHRDHVVCNPLSLAKVDELVEVLRLPAGARLLDVACGKAEVAIRVVERYGATGVGVDLSPYFVRQARSNVAARLGGPAPLEIVEQDGAAFNAEPGSFDLAMCVGASWVFGGYRGTLRALKAFARPGGLVVSGEPYWRRPPDEAEAASADFDVAAIGTHAGNVAAGLEEGLDLLYTIVSSEHDWDRYQGLQWQAAERWAADNPGDPDVAEVLALMRAGRDRYFEWERDCLGWAVYVFGKPRAAGRR